MSRRSPETLADYLVVGVCPALIMLLVGSLMWFLVEVFYQGEYKGRLLWVMAMWVMGIVGIARIAMERGMAYASLFGWGLGAAVALVLSRLVEGGLVVGGPIMVVVWWAAHKLTWDCTLIDDTQDATGQGLLDQMGLDPSSAGVRKTPPGTTSRPGDVEALTTKAEEASPPWWETILEPDRRPHAPGVWVVYFSLAALPIFGFGGWFVSEQVARARVFGLTVIYVASGMGLLLATSFLGLRRYLRQRKLEMPLEMTSTWIVVGVVMICAMLVVATILPRPSREYSLSQLPFTVTSAVRRASEFAVGKGGTKDDEAKNAATTEAKEGQETERKGGKREGKSESGEQEGKGNTKGTKDTKGGKPGGESGDSGDSKSSGGDGKGSKDDKSSSGESKGGGEKKGRSAEAESKGEEPKSESSEESKSEEAQGEQGQESQKVRSTSDVLSRVSSYAGQAVGTLIRWLFYVALLVGVVVAAWIYRDEVRAAWLKMMEELRESWEKWFGKKKVAFTGEIGPVEAPPRMFASFADPFVSGEVNRMPWPRLVRYSFEALEAWGREQGVPRAVGQTPHEFAAAVAAAEPGMAANVQMLAGWYGQLAYAAGGVGKGSVEELRELWGEMRGGSRSGAGSRSG